MFVWTVQPAAVWESLAANGTLTVDHRYSGNLHHSYDWLRRRLPSYIAEYAGNYPWWAYCNRPDLRAVRHQQPRGELCYLIELALPRQQVVDFPFWAWEVIYQGRFLARTRRESENWRCRMIEAVIEPDQWPPPQPWLSELENSWELLFDRSLPNQGWLRSSETSSSHSKREAVFEALDLSCVQDVTEFVGSNPAMTRRRILSWYRDQSELDTA